MNTKAKLKKTEKNLKRILGDEWNGKGTTSGVKNK